MPPPPKPPELFDRTREWASLAACLDRAGPDLYLVLGRRRAGKSYLLTRFVRAAGGVFYQATKRTEREQLLALSRVLGEHFDDAALRRGIAFPDWEDLFRYVVDRAGGAPFVLVLDEFPYLAEAAPALPSILQELWDHALPATRLKLVLSGSHVSAMKRLTEADQPLFGRRTGRVDVRPFDYYDAARFVPAWAARDKLRLYAAFGGLPGHLALVRPDEPFEANVARHVLDPASRLYDEAAHAFDAFVADAGVHYSIVEAVASGERKWSKIANRVGKQTSALQRPLEWLLDMEVVERAAPITEYPNPNPKRVLYGVTDPYLQFWHAFVADVRARGLATLAEPEEVWARYVAPRFEEYVGAAFEEACRQFVARSRHAALPFRPVQVGRWWSADSAEEVDVVALDGEGGLLVGECKWGPVGSRELDTLKRRAALVAAELPRVTSLTRALFSAGGLEAGEVAGRIEAGEALYFPIEELYAARDEG